MGSHSKFSLAHFDSNVCLNCSVKFMNDGEMETQKIHFLDALDEEHESVSVFSALNSAFKIPINKQIEEEQGIAFGCCPACSKLLGNLYELQRELDILRNMDSVVSKILEANQSDSDVEELEVEPCIMDTDDTDDENSEIAEDQLQFSPQGVEIRPDDSVIEPNTNTTFPASGQGQPEPIPGLAQDFAATTLRCINCCAEIEHSTTGLYQNPLAKQAVGAVMCSGAPVKIQIADVLNHILKLPLQNIFTADTDFKMCIDCARMLLNVHVCYSILESVAKPESHLNFIYQQIRSFIVSGFIQNSYGFSNAVQLPVTNVNVSRPSPQTKRVTKSSKDTEAAETDRERLSESMDIDTFNGSDSDPDDAASAPAVTRTFTDLSGLTLAERKARRNELRRKLPVITFDPCPHCGVVLKSKKTTALRDHMKRRHPRATPTRKVTKTSNGTAVGHTRKAKQSEFMNIDSGAGTPTVPKRWKELSLAERRARYNELRRNLPVVTFDPCPHCGVVLKSNKTTALKEHIKRQHSDMAASACGICGRPYFSFRKKQIHEQWSHLSAAEKAALRSQSQDPNYLSEPGPNKKYAMSAERKERNKKQKSEYRKKMPVITHDPCPHCGLVIKSKFTNAVKYHIMRLHDLIFACDICGKPLQDKTSKRNHEKTHLSSEERAKLREVEPPPPTWLCPECGKTLHSETAIKSHLKNVHADIETRRIHCQEVNCDYTCLDKGSFKRHMKEVHDPTFEPKYRCKICGEAFRMYSELKEHKMAACEASSRPFPCDQGTCSRRFKLKHALMLHLHTVHTLTPEEARRKLYPGLDCPDWIYNRAKKDKN